MTHLHTELVPFIENRELAPRVLYWGGVAMWRRALNGFYEAADRIELAEDLTQCVADLGEALSRDPGFADAKGGASSCLVNHVADRLRAAQKDYEGALWQPETVITKLGLFAVRRTFLRILGIRMRPSGKQDCAWRTH